MDPIENIDINGDSTFVMGLEAQARGHRIWHYLPTALSLRDGRVSAQARRLELRREIGSHFTLGDFEPIDLAEVDVVLMRQDPPFDMAYITATHILEHIHPKTLVVNDPAQVRNAPEKLFVTHFEGVMPPTLITSDLSAIVDFREEHEDIIIKPLFGNGGAGVFHLQPGDENLSSLHELFSHFYREPTNSKPRSLREGPIILQISISRAERPDFTALPPTCIFARASPAAGTRSIAPAGSPSINIIRLSPSLTSGR